MSSGDAYIYAVVLKDYNVEEYKELMETVNAFVKTMVDMCTSCHWNYDDDGVFQRCFPLVGSCVNAHRSGNATNRDYKWL